MAPSRVAASSTSGFPRWSGKENKEYRALNNEVDPDGALKSDLLPTMAWDEGSAEGLDSSDMSEEENEDVVARFGQLLGEAGQDQRSTTVIRSLPTHLKTMTSQQRARRLLNGKNPWGRNSRCSFLRCRCCDKTSKSKTTPNQRRRRRRVRAILIRGTHVALSVFVLAVFISHDSSKIKLKLLDAFYNEGGLSSGLYCAGYLSLYLAALVAYFVACLRDPGYVPVDPGGSNRAKGKYYWNDVAASVDGVPDPFSRHRLPHDSSKPLLRECGFCGIPAPLRSRHCEDCGSCVRRFDHHCPWLDTCVGQKNHAAFWWFLFLECLNLGWSLYISFVSLVRYKPYERSLSEIVLLNLGYIINFLILLPTFSLVTGLLCFHSYLACVNATTWETTSRLRITYLAELDDDLEPFDSGCCCNLLQFCCVMRGSDKSSFRWESIYLNRVAKHDQDSALEMDPL